MPLGLTIGLLVLAFGALIVWLSWGARVGDDGVGPGPVVGHNPDHFDLPGQRTTTASVAPGPAPGPPEPPSGLSAPPRRLHGPPSPDETPWRVHSDGHSPHIATEWCGDDGCVPITHREMESIWIDQGRERIDCTAADFLAYWAWVDADPFELGVQQRYLRQRKADELAYIAAEHERGLTSRFRLERELGFPISG